jgi:hypothetical protein
VPTATRTATRGHVVRAPASRWVAVGAAALLVGGCVLAGWWLVRGGTDLHLGNTYPVGGHYRLHLGPWLVPALMVAAGIIGFGPELARRLSWRRLLPAAWLGAGLWAVALAAVAGPAAITAPLAKSSEYLAEVDRVTSMGVREYLAVFADHIVAGPDRFGWTTHVAGHPPLATLVFSLLARAGLAGPGWASALCITVGASAAASVLATVRLLAGERLARRAAPFVVLAPVALWVATSADALFAGVAAAGIRALAAAAAHHRNHRDAPPGGAGNDLVAARVLSVVGGLALGTCLMLSYGLVLLAPVALAVVLVAAGTRRGAATVLAVGAIAALAVPAGFATAGFWWPEGFARTADRVVIGAGWQDRPTAYFLFANPAALAMAVGPAVVAALPLLARLRNRECGGDLRRLATPALGALLAVGVAIASNLSKGEVERIYLPFAVWLLPLAALLPAGDADRSTGADGGGGAPARGWLVAQAGWALLIAATTTLAW